MKGPGTTPRHRSAGPFHRAGLRYRRNIPAVLSLAFVFFVVVIAIFGPLLRPYDPNAQDLIHRFALPSGRHWLGTDDLGRDMLSRLITGAQVSMRVAFQVVGSALLIGVPVGLVSGYVGGKVDMVIMRATDALMSIPGLVLALAIAGVLGPGITNAAYALTILYLPAFVRLMRGQTLVVRNEVFVEASYSIGTPTRRIILHRVLPNAISPIIIQTSIALGSALLAEAALSYLGLGVQPPDASWGNMLQEAFNYIYSHQWMMFVSGTALALTVLAFNTIGDGLRDALGVADTPKRRRRSRRGFTTVVALPGNGHAELNSLDQTALAAKPREPAIGSFSGSSVAPLEKAEVLRVENLDVMFDTPRGRTLVVDHVNLTIREGETLGLVGESGSGKSVTALSIMRLLPSPPAFIAADRIVVAGQDVSRMSFRDVRALRGPTMAMVFQDPMTSLNPAFTVGVQLAESVRWHTHASRKQAQNRALELLDLVGIPRTRLKAYPHELSGGMRQRVMIGIALSCKPKLLIVDEPTTALDVTIQAQILELLSSLRDELGMSMLFVTHDLGVVAEICDRVSVMYAGQIVEETDVVSLYHEPRHPYSEGLLRAMPDEAPRGEPLYTIPGQVPAPGEYGAGCRFANRCSYAIPACTAGVPSLDTVRNGIPHLVRCSRVDELELKTSVR
jgi:peptide/nickel transport system permease protein